ncbi:thermonuclease [Bhargavaea cecembensis]|uniref:Thermonuclease n=1 Tax=Bhargavaea cecembensis TaxID=394098 RepID=A0A165HFF6_9BACL|nr:thermonuclease family protein [Bhargavaea cecembensis]KZE39759.1 thermonuclease [Bhargavaea cecembensis]
MANRKSTSMWKSPAGAVAVLLVIAIIYFLAEIPEDESGQESPTDTGEHIPADAPAEGLITVELVRTIDGDTIKIRYRGKEQNVRYLLIDTPETNHPQLGKQPFGDRAKERNRELLANSEVAIEFDIGQRTDKYGRLLAYVYADGESVQEKLLEEGLARVGYVYPPNTRHLESYEQAEKRAKDRRTGIWSIEDYATERGFDAEKAERSGGSRDRQNKDAGPFANCRELRSVYPEGVKRGHPAYSERHDGDGDGMACEAS